MKKKMQRSIRIVFSVVIVLQISFSIFSYFYGAETRDLIYRFSITILMLLAFIIMQIAETSTQFLIMKRVEYEMIINVLNTIMRKENTNHNKENDAQKEPHTGSN